MTIGHKCNWRALWVQLTKVREFWGFESITWLGVPVSTLRNHVYGKTTHCKRGIPNTLACNEERNWLHSSRKWQILGILSQMLFKVAKTTQECLQDPFKTHTNGFSIFHIFIIWLKSYITCMISMLNGFLLNEHLSNVSYWGNDLGLLYYQINFGAKYYLICHVPHNYCLNHVTRLMRHENILNYGEQHAS